MGYYTIVMPREHAWEVLNELGELNALQFVDSNVDQAPFNKLYSNYVKRCDEMENKVQFIENEMVRFKKPIQKCDNANTFLQNLKRFLGDRQKAEHTYFDEVENELDDKLKNLLEQVKIRDTLIDKYNHLVEYRQILLRAYSYVGHSGYASQDLAASGSFQREEEAKNNLSRNQDNIRFTYLAGVIDKEDSLRFKRILFRVTRGMVWTTLIDIERPQNEAEKTDYDHLMDTTHEKKHKTIFLIIYQGGSYDMLAGKLNKICDSFGASKYGLPSDKSTYDRRLIEVENQLRESKSVVGVTEKHVDMILQNFSRPRGHDIHYSLIEEFKMFIIKEKVIYNNLNKLKLQNTLYRGNCWCPVKVASEVYSTINQLKKRRSDIGGCEFQETASPTELKPPTYFRTNEATGVFQEIVNTYGIPRYMEINPALFAIATFPFLFGVMFGDIGHGALIFFAGAYLCLFKSSIERNQESLWRMVLPARYLLLLQGFFAFYCGLIYNDFMAIPLNIFGTCYKRLPDDSKFVQNDCTYSFGIDPAWYGTSNELTYLNSFKMKLSIVIGVSQMIFGIILRGLNNIYFRSWIDFIFEFIPMLVFMSLTFGYMVVLIFIKWSIPWGTEKYPISEAPSIISIFIKMALKPGEWPDGSGRALYGDPEGIYQADLQSYFLIIAMVCGILILFPKPLILWFRHRKSFVYNLVTGDNERGAGRNLLNQDFEHIRHLDEEHKDDSSENKLLERSRSNSSHSHSGIEADHFEFGEVFVHQVIEAIEFILGSISNTASYLRLWALSLAHSQLAKVFFDNTLESSIKSGSVFGIFFGFSVFAIITLGVLLLMDQMECFLHALRLHWVEFQNKFYKADGYIFDAFSFVKPINEAINK